jgi:hypothetical protein
LDSLIAVVLAIAESIFRVLPFHEKGHPKDIKQFRWSGTETHASDFRFLKTPLDEQAEKKYTLSTNKRNKKLRRTQEMGSYRSRSIYQLHI